MNKLDITVVGNIIYARQPAQQSLVPGPLDTNEVESNAVSTEAEKHCSCTVALLLLSDICIALSVSVCPGLVWIVYWNCTASAMQYLQVILLG